MSGGHVFQSRTIISQGRARHPALLDPWETALLFGPGTVMAVLTATHGPTYRSLGTAMAIAPDGRFAGALSSGCIEADLILRAQEVRASGQPQQLRYGQGSPFIDLRLPCGGAIEVSLFVIQDPAVLSALSRERAARREAALHLAPDGALRLLQADAPTLPGLRLTFRPPLRFVIFGAGPEAAVFAQLVQSLDYDHLLLSHDDHSLNAAGSMGCNTRRLGHLPDMAAVVGDARCAALLFYHDHEHEPQILQQLLEGPAFYIGAQGSRRTQQDRLARLAELGLAEESLQRVRGPIGLVPSARDPRQLAVSVLAEVIGLAAPVISAETLA